MELLKIRNIAAACMMMLLFTNPVFSQNKDVEKGKETLNKAMDQKDASKRQGMIQDAREHFQKGGMKPQEIAMLLGDAYLAKGDLQNAASNYGAASKEDKKEGYKKVADAYLESAFSGDEKNEAKMIRNAMNYYNKGDAAKEGARNIGDKYYEKGAEGYDKAIDYYIQGDAKSKVEQIAKEVYAKGGDNESKAGEIYLKLKSPEGYQMGGDIFFAKKEYQKAIDAYLAGNVKEGIRKYADYLYSQNRNEEADNLFVKLGEILAKAKDDTGLEKLASECMHKGSYDLAARIYDKAGNTTMADKCHGYASLIAFNLDSAKIYFTNINDMAMVKTINDNTKQLTPLKDIAENFDELMRNAPHVNMITDSVSGMTRPSESDQKLLEDYYKSIRDQIVKNVFDVAANMAKLNNADLKKYAGLRFVRYGAIRKILDTDTFTVKKQKADIKVKDVVL